MAEIPERARAFGLVAPEYERWRPGYPTSLPGELVRRLELAPGSRVLDLAAGTGKLTRLLHDAGFDVVAVEPIDEMRSELERGLPAVEAVAGTAEAIPLPAASVDAVTVAQAFHWFRPDEAVREIRRVLRPGGGLAVLWNARDLADPLQAELARLLEPFGWEDIEARLARAAAAIAAPGLFAELEELTLRNPVPSGVEQLVGRVMTISHVAAAEPAAREELLARVRDLAATRGDPFTLAMLTRAWLARAR